MPASRPFHVMTKPRGAVCNLDCTYCYYLEKERLYPPDADPRMGREVLEAYVRQYLASQDTPEVTFGWQGGEPTLMGLDFFREVVALQEEHGEGKTILNTLQTNGTLLDDEWCAFLAENGFLVGLSVDGPEELHDGYRVDKGGKPTFAKVMAGLELLTKHGVEFNTLTVVHRKNQEVPLEVYRFLKEIGSGFHQYIPLVEREPDARARAMGLDLAGPPQADSTPPVTPWSVEPEPWGRFLMAIFDEWVRNDVGRVFVQTFDAALGKWVGVPRGLCIFDETCGGAMALEHNGDLYACDHYVYPDFKLGNILERPMAELAHLPAQLAFGEAKKDTLPRYCLECEVRFACKGECPKHRFLTTPHGEPGLNYLCRGYRRFFNHIGPSMETMAALLEQRRPPAGIMRILARVG